MLSQPKRCVLRALTGLSSLTLSQGGLWNVVKKKAQAQVLQILKVRARCSVWWVSVASHYSFHGGGGGGLL